MELSLGAVNTNNEDDTIEEINVDGDSAALAHNGEDITYDENGDRYTDVDECVNGILENVLDLDADEDAFDYGGITPGSASHNRLVLARTTGNFDEDGEPTTTGAKVMKKIRQTCAAAIEEES